MQRHRGEEKYLLKTSAAHMRATCYHFFFNYLYFYFENLIRTLICYVSLSLFFLSLLHCTFTRKCQTLHWNPAGAQISSPISPKVSCHVSFSLSVYIYIYIMQRIRIFIKYHLSIFLDLELKICVSLMKATWIINFLS